MSGGTRSYEMARRIVDAGHEVHMVTSRTDSAAAGSDWTQESIQGINVHWLPVPYDNSMDYKKRIQAFFRFATKAARRAASLDADVVFATSTPLTIAIPAIWAKWRLNVPMVFEVRDLWPELPIAMGALNNPLARIAARWLEVWAYRNAAQIVALSPGMSSGIAQTGYPQDRIHCIPNSSDISLFNVPAVRGEAFRFAREWLGARPLVLYAGTFGKINGVGYLVEVARAMLPLNPEVRFLALGEGSELQSVSRRAAELGVLEKNFFIEGPVPKNSMPDVLSAANISTSLFIRLEAMQQNSANKFFDTLAAGRPIAINHGGWQADIIRQEKCGLVLDADNPTNAARSILEFLEDDEAQKLARQSAFSLARTRYDRDTLARELIAVLEETRR